jgi:phage-related protein
MDKLFDIVFLDEVLEFLERLDKKHSGKILFNIRKAQMVQDPELLEKLQDDIWELRTLYQKAHYRLFCFWDKNEHGTALVISTHGIIKKTGKVPPKEILKAKQIRSKYFEDKNK